MSGDKKTSQDAVSVETENTQAQDVAAEEEAVTPESDLTSPEATEETAETPEVSDDETPSAETDADDSDAPASEEEEVEAVDEDIEPTEPEAPETPPVTQPVTQVVKRGGFVPMVLGGVVCAALGYAGAQFLKPEGWPFPGANTQELEQQITALEGQLAEIKSATEDSATAQTAALGDLRSEFETQFATRDDIAKLDEIAEQIAGFEDRMTEIEARPVAEAIVSPEATAAYERQLAQMQDLLDSEIARLEEAKEQSIAEETAARIATAKSRLQTRVDAGEPFNSVLSEFGDDIPEALKLAAEGGIPSVSALQESYSDAARAALVASSRAAYEAGEQNWFQTALQTQIGLRSTTPKEGDDADAVLSRAEQSVRDGLFAEAIATLDLLPDAGKAEMQDWIAQAQKRVDVMIALDEFLGR